MKRRYLISLALVLLVALLAGCVAPPAAPAAESPAGDASAPEEPRPGGQLVVFASSDPGTLDPALLASYDQTLITPNIVEGLFRLSPDGQTVEPAIAESYTASEDGTVWTFTIRPDVKFHNGDAVTADDVKYSLERVMDPATASPKAWMLESVSSIEVTDPSTVVISLSRPLGFFHAMLANPGLAMVSPRAVEEFGEDFGQNVVSAGPFKLGTWNLNQDITLEAFDEYWNGRPYVDTVLYRVIGDENTRMVEFDAGTLDITWVPPAHWDRISNDPVLGDELGRAETFHTELYAVNMEREPLGTNPLVRQAICHAISREAAIASLQGRASNAQGILPPGLLGFNPDASICPYDLERARALLAEAGFPDGLPGEFELLMPPWGNLVKLNEIYQANLKEVGINIVLKPLEFGPYLEALDAGDYDIAWIYRVADYADPDSFYYPMLHSDSIGGGGNVARYSIPEADAAIITGRESVDESARLDAYGTVDALFAADLPYIPLTHNIYVDVHQPRVEGYVPSPMDTHVYQNVWLSDDTE